MLFTFLDKTLVCQDCGKEFIWSANEQEFYAVMGFDNDPKRCSRCRRLRRYGPSSSSRHRIVCAACEKEDSVSFVPVKGRPVHCRKCYRAGLQQTDVA